MTPAQKAVATLGGAGLSPLAPGTCGSLVALVPCLLVPGAAYPWALGLGALAATVISVLLARRLDPVRDGDDPPWFVVDEAAGLWVAALAPAAPGPLWVLVAFALFRLFDVWKPPPIRRSQDLGGGVGIVLDDLLAGLYALTLTRLLAAL